MSKMQQVAFLYAMIFLLASTLMGGDYHHGETLICYDCHVMHYSQTHGYGSDGTGTWIPLGGDGPYEHLLRNEVNDLCLACHDNQIFAPDVFMENNEDYVREAGALNRGIAPYYDATGHTLGSTDPAPGSNPQWNTDQGLTCVDCHQPHGWNPNGNAWRNVRDNPGNYEPQSISVIITYAVGTNDLTKDVFERSQDPGPAHYDISNVDFNEPDPEESTYGKWCKGCHTLIHGAAGDPNMGGEYGTQWLRHPQAGADIGVVGGRNSSKRVFSGRGMGKHNWVKVMTSTGNWTPHNENQVVDHTPSCFTCHKAHGNKNPFGLIFMKFRGTVTEEGTEDGELRHLCGQCHVQAAHPRQGPGECNECHPQP